MPFEVLTRVGPRSHVLDGGRDPRLVGAVLGGVVRPIQKHCKSPLRTPQPKIGNGVSCYVYAAKGIIQSSIMARHAMRPFVKILQPLAFIGWYKTAETFYSVVLLNQNDIWVTPCHDLTQILLINKEHVKANRSDFLRQPRQIF